MIDWFKIELMNRPAAEIRQKLDFIKPVNMKTGEILGTFEICYLRRHNEPESAISVKIFPSGRVWVQGSIHKFWHGQNHSILTHSEMQKAFAFLFKTLGTRPESSKFLQIEFALNLYPDFNPDEFINRLICFKTKPFEGLGNFEKIGKRCYNSEYDMKIYNKGKQYKLKQNVLRIEKKVKDSRYLKRFGICAVSDLTTLKTRELLLDLFTSIDDLLIDDKSIDESRITARQVLALAKYRNPNFWSEISKRERYKAKERFQNLILKFGSEKYLNTVKNLAQKESKNISGKGDFSEHNKKVERGTFPKFKYGSETSFSEANKY